jgi:HEAT repeat protein
LFLVANALGNLCDRGPLSEGQKKEAATIAKKFALGKNDSSVRTDALYGVTACDPAGAEAFLKGLLKDPDERVKKSAQERLAKLKKR